MSETTDVFRAIGDPRRRRILDLLASKERSVGELTADLRIAQPSVTQHLKVLTTVGLVESTKDGNRSIYRLRGSALGEVSDWIASLTR